MAMGFSRFLVATVSLAAAVLLGAGQLTSGAGHQPADWNYRNQAAWSKNYPDCGPESMRQSPINIVENQNQHNDNLDLELVNYNQPLPGSMINNGHSISTVFRQTAVADRPYLKLNWLGKRNDYYLDEIHFHWGVQASRGSEHKVNGMRSFAEMHLVHIKRGLTRDDIGRVDDAAAVLGVFIELKEQNPNGELTNIIRTARGVNNTAGEVMRDYRIGTARGLLPVNLTPMYSYLGSLTTPPCFESVTWLIFSRPIYTTKAQLYQLSDLFTKDDDDEGSHIIGNTFRKTQQPPAGPVYVTSKVRYGGA